MSEHKILFSLIVLASFANLGWVLIIYVLSFRGARWLVDGIAFSDVPRRRELRLASSPGLRQISPAHALIVQYVWPHRYDGDIS